MKESQRKGKEYRIKWNKKLWERKGREVRWKGIRWKEKRKNKIEK
jgi:hypothetical protein